MKPTVSVTTTSIPRPSGSSGDASQSLRERGSSVAKSLSSAITLTRP